MNLDILQSAIKKEREILLGARLKNGAWRGRLSSSAVSTAVAACAFFICDSKKYEKQILSSLNWLVGTQLETGGWGDSEQSPENPTATILSLCALSFFREEEKFRSAFAKASQTLKKYGDFSSASGIKNALLAIYGKDLTFSVPILTLCAVSGLMGNEASCWREVPRLPFELALLPQRLFGALKLPVVSYAIPALVCVGMAVAHKRNSFLWRFEKSKFADFLLSKIERMQPSSGGFLEASPLTAFCAVCLKLLGRENSFICKNALKFLENSQRSDGSFAIDSDLGQWLTSMAASVFSNEFSEDEKAELFELILSRQFKTQNSFTGAAPWAWGWTDSDGAVPEADDTCASLFALSRLSVSNASSEIERGIEWLLNLQNSDGGMPTFCKGWNILPFDKSCADISAHAIKALCAWEGRVSRPLAKKMKFALQKLQKFLENSQSEDGSWESLWFGDQFAKGGVSKILGTAMVLEYLGESHKKMPLFAEKAADFLAENVRADFTWGEGNAGNSLISAKAISALSHFKKYESLAVSAAGALLGFKPNLSEPIGLYFAKLWYSEDLYSPIFKLKALKKISIILLKQCAYAG